jgi:predicted enzyme related to lactoylglutathione lyase
MADQQNGIVWYELMTTDQDAAGRFYADVLKWQVEQSSTAPNGYRIISGPGGRLGGSMPLPPGAAQMGMKPNWVFYVSVADADAAAARVAAAGGAIHMPGTDIPGTGRFAFVADPQGANFYVMKTIGEGPATSHNPDLPGHGAWHELHTSDGAAAFDFYAAEFGWEADGVFDMGPMGAYRLFKLGDVQSGGMMTDANAPHPYWAIYFRVDDIDAAAGRIKAAGGTIAFGPSEVPGGGWIINGVDPQGAMFSVTGPRV